MLGTAGGIDAMLPEFRHSDKHNTAHWAHHWEQRETQAILHCRKKQEHIMQLYLTVHVMSCLPFVLFREQVVLEVRELLRDIRKIRYFSSLHQSTHSSSHYLSHPLFLSLYPYHSHFQRAIRRRIGSELQPGGLSYKSECLFLGCLLQCGFFAY